MLIIILVKLSHHHLLIITGLHIIIFDEIDAICKARGSSGGESSGVIDAFIHRLELSNLLLLKVNDTVVNQLLSKIDGVDQLNNILVIGMTNRCKHATFLGLL